MFCESLLSRDGRRNRGCRARKSDEKSIALCGYFVPIMLRENAAQRVAALR